jgi:hypothetical protein
MEKEKLKKLKDKKIIDMLQAQCVHRRATVFSQNGHNFLKCLDCEKRFYKVDI